MESQKVQNDLTEEVVEQPPAQQQQENPPGGSEALLPESMSPAPAGLPSDNNTEEFKTQNYLTVTHKAVGFNKILYPGAYDQIEIKLSLKPGCLQDQEDQTAFMVKIVAKCEDDELNALDEYVYSVRYYTERLQFFEEVRFRIRQKTTDFFRVAVKMPALKKPMKIKGTLYIQLEDTKPLQIPIQSECTIPSIVPMKTLWCEDSGLSVIKLAVRRVGKPAPILFKNNSGSQLTLEVEVVGDNEQIIPYDLSVANPVISVMPFQQFMVQLMSKHIESVKTPKFMVAHKGLLIKIKTSCVFYCFPVQITFMDVAATIMG